MRLPRNYRNTNEGFLCISMRISCSILVHDLFAIGIETLFLKTDNRQANSCYIPGEPEKSSHF